MPVWCPNCKRSVGDQYREVKVAVAHGVRLALPTRRSGAADPGTERRRGVVTGMAGGPSYVPPDPASPASPDARSSSSTGPGGISPTTRPGIDTGATSS